MKLQFAAMLLLGACTAPLITASNIPPDASDAATYGEASPGCIQACRQLAAIGCPKGSAPNCATRLDMTQANRLVRLSDGQAFTCELVTSKVRSSADLSRLGFYCN